MKFMAQRNSIFTLIRFLILLLLLLLHSMPIKAQESTDDDDEREFSYIIGSDRGPERWGELYPDWAACKNGTMQSPINLPYQSSDTIPRSMGIQRNYKPQNTTLINRGHDIMLQWEGDAGSVLINGTTFALRQVHWHSPSEHKINGIRYALELHMVHQSTTSNTNNLKESVAVIAVLYRFGHPDSFLSELASKIASVMDQKDAKINAGEISPMNIQMNGRKFYKYKGSLTTPPCTQGVNWIIIKEIQTVSKRHVELLRAAVDDDAKNNARPLQPRNNRDVNLYFTSEEY